MPEIGQGIAHLLTFIVWIDEL